MIYESKWDLQSFNYSDGSGKALTILMARVKSLFEYQV
jgi:hypothetical protein